MNHPIPEPALDKHIAFLGSTGSGKTSSIKSAIVETALKNEERVLIIDPTSAWWGFASRQTSACR
jgi:DNA helicase HerA-like ATPase